MQVLVIFLLFAALLIGRLSRGGKRAFILYGLVAALAIAIELPLLWR